MPRVSRNTHSSGVESSTSAAWDWPLMESEIILGPPIVIGEKDIGEKGVAQADGFAAALTACSIALSLPKTKSQMRDWPAAGASPLGAGTALRAAG
jgi:hypothetical protein